MNPSNQQVSALEKWATDTAALLVGSMEQDLEPDWSDSALRGERMERAIANYREDWKLLRLKVAISLIQARAMEARHISGELLLKAGSNQYYRVLALHLSDRAAKLEEFGMEMANRAAGEAPKEEPPQEPMVRLQ